ncbi:APC family permease [Paenibacillus sp. PR3]|uniref:APC family permease n=1 Tax=Paenibacillus terricola TaxID=2763503 RepID=A0ABR8MUW5_9BACL|nr:APC family permease [Paenibacillus terricola]
MNFWAFFGWENITHLVPELKNPKRDVMRSMWVSVAIIGVVYALLSLVTVGTETYGKEVTTAPLALLIGKAIGVGAGAATSVIACRSAPEILVFPSGSANVLDYERDSGAAPIGHNRPLGQSPLFCHIYHHASADCRDTRPPIPPVFRHQGKR